MHSGEKAWTNLQIIYNKLQVQRTATATPLKYNFRMSVITTDLDVGRNKTVNLTHLLSPLFYRLSNVCRRHLTFL